MGSKVAFWRHHLCLVIMFRSEWGAVPAVPQHRQSVRQQMAHFQGYYLSACFCPPRPHRQREQCTQTSWVLCQGRPPPFCSIGPCSHLRIFLVAILPRDPLQPSWFPLHLSDNRKRVPSTCSRCFLEPEHAGKGSIRLDL